MTQPRIAAFARLANGNVTPSRVIEGQAARLGRSLHGIDYDAVHDEIVAAHPNAAAVLVFRGGANENEAPIRVIQGPRTKLLLPHSVAVDAKNNELIVADPGGRSVLIFPRDADGDVAPLRVIQGSKTRLDYLIGLAVDHSRNLLVVSSVSRSRQQGLYIFNRTDNGNVAPRAIISGPKTGIVASSWQVQVYGGKIFAAITNARYSPAYSLLKVRKGLRPDVEILSPWRSTVLGFIGVWNTTDNGDVAPRAIIRGLATGLVHPASLALNVKDGEIYVSDSVRNGTFTFLVPQFFGKMK